MVFHNHCNTLLHCNCLVTQLHIDILTFGILSSWPPSAQVIIPTLPNAEMLVRKVLLRVLVLLPYGKQWHVMFKDWTVCPWLGVKEMMNAWITFPQGLGLRDRFWIRGIGEIWIVLKGDSCSESRNNTKICKDNEEIVDCIVLSMGMWVCLHQKFLNMILFIWRWFQVSGSKSWCWPRHWHHLKRLYSNLAAAYIELADTAGTYQHASRVIDLALVPRASWV